MYMRLGVLALFGFFLFPLSFFISSVVLLRAATLCLCSERLEKWGRVGEAFGWDGGSIFSE